MSATFAPTECPECRYWGAHVDHCAVCKGLLYYCVQCQHRVVPPAEYRIKQDCDCWKPPETRPPQ